MDAIAVSTDADPPGVEVDDWDRDAGGWLHEAQDGARGENRRAVAAKRQDGNDVEAIDLSGMFELEAPRSSHGFELFSKADVAGRDDEGILDGFVERDRFLVGEGVLGLGYEDVGLSEEGLKGEAIDRKWGSEQREVDVARVQPPLK